MSLVERIQGSTPTLARIFEALNTANAELFAQTSSLFRNGGETSFSASISLEFLDARYGAKLMQAAKKINKPRFLRVVFHGASTLC